MKLKSPSEGHNPKGAHGRAAVKALGRTKTTGNFKKIEAAKGKGAAIGAYQNALKAHKGREHNGPTAHVGKSGMHYGAHSGTEAITAQKGHCCDCE
jgi:hypothetical protein